MNILENKFVQIIIACVIPFTGGFLVNAIFPRDEASWIWYNGLIKPRLQPPQEVKIIFSRFI
jgi:tryptophan-rich sensory protein